MSLMLVAATAAFAPSAHAEVVPYNATPNAVASAAYSLTVDGQPVTVEKFGDISYARFSFTGTIQVAVQSASPITSATVSPSTHVPVTSTSGNTLGFALSQPQKLIVQVSGSEKLFLFADGPERNAPVPGSPGVTNLASYLQSGRDPSVPVTAELNKAIADVSAAGGGTLFLPAGLYMSAQVVLMSNVSLYLDSGALLRAVPTFNSTNYPVQNGSDSAFVYIPNADHVKIGGRGIIDGNGWQVRTNAPGSGNLKLVRANGATNLDIGDVMLRDSARWTMHLLGSDNVNVHGVRLVNDLRTDGTSALPFVSNTDGFDIDASTNVTIADSFVYTTDDAFTPKVTGYMGIKRPSHDLTLRDNVIFTRKAALKVGSEVLDDIYNVRFYDNDVVLADRMFAMWNEGGATIRHVVATSNRAETIGVADNKNFFYHYIRVNPGQIDDITVDGVMARTKAPNDSRVEGFDATHRVTNFNVRNMYVAGAAINAAGDVPLVMRNAYYANVSVNAPVSQATVNVTASDDFGIEGRDTGTFTFTRAGAIDAPLTVAYTLSGTAVNGTDYDALSGSVTIPAGSQQASIIVTPRADSVVEPDETVVLGLAAGSGYAVGDFASATMTIADGPVPVVTPPPPPPPVTDATPTVTVSVQDGFASEVAAFGNPGKFRITRSGSTAQPLTVAFLMTGAAINGVDYQLVLPLVTIRAGASYAMVRINPYADGLVESNESVVLTVLPVFTYKLGATATSTFNINNVN